MSGDINRCPVMGMRPTPPMKNEDWWPKQVNLKILSQNSNDPHLYGKSKEKVPYSEAFKSLDLAAVKKDIMAVSVGFCLY